MSDSKSEVQLTDAKDLLSPMFLTFTERLIQQKYERHRSIRYAKLMPILALAIILYTLALEMGSRRGGEKFQAAVTPVTKYVNYAMCAVAILLTCLVRCSTTFTWFACPFATLYMFYYATAIQVEPEGVTYQFTIPIGLSSAYLILVAFNEVWLISVAMFAPICGFVIFYAGRDMKGTDSGNELIVRVFWCILAYGMVAYQLERQSKMAFIAKIQNKECAAGEWLNIFESFPEGIALIRKGSLAYANSAITNLFMPEDQIADVNQPLPQIQEMLENVLLTRFGMDDNYKSSVYSFVFSQESSAIFQTWGVGYGLKKEKVISLNKVRAQVNGQWEKLLIIRDLTCLYQKQTSSEIFDRKDLNPLTEQIMRQIQESTHNSMLNLINFEDHVKPGGHSFVYETLQDVQRVTQRLTDFELIYNIFEGVYDPSYSNFSVQQKFISIQNSVRDNLERTNVKLTVDIDENVPDQIFADVHLFKQTCINLIYSAAHELKNSTIMIKVALDPGMLLQTTIIVIQPQLKPELIQEREQMFQSKGEQNLSRMIQLDNVDINSKISMLLCKYEGSALRFTVLPKQIEWQFTYEVQEKNETVTPGADTNQDDIIEGNMLDQLKQEENNKYTKSVQPIALLYNCFDLVEDMNKMHVPFEELFVVDSLMESIKVSIQQWGGKGCNRVRVVFVDLDDGSVNPKKFMQKIKQTVNAEDPMQDLNIDVIALSSAPGDRIKTKCEALGMKYMQKPVFELKRVMKPYIEQK